MIYVAIYLAAIVVANLSVAALGPQAVIVNAFLLIGLDLTLRDKLHDRWNNDQLALRMGALILAGGYARTMGVSVDAEVTRIAWRYVPEFQHEAAAAMERAVG
jgi:hypothetical protein